MDDQPNVTRRKPSRFRPLHSFSLRTLFVVVTVLCLLAWLIHWVEAQRQLAHAHLEGAQWMASHGWEFDTGHMGPLWPSNFVRSYFGTMEPRIIGYPVGADPKDIERIQSTFPDLQLLEFGPGHEWPYGN